MREYNQGFAQKHRNQWRAVISWQEEGGQRRRIRRSTGVRCYPNKRDADSRFVK